MKSSLALLFIALVPALAPGAPLQRDLGLGLVYERVRTLPGDLPGSGAVRGHPCILDLRFATGDRAASAALAPWLKAQCSLHTPVFLLANTGTSPALLAVLPGLRGMAGLVILGAAGPGFQPDIALRVAPDAERRAYAALDGGAPIGSLLEEYPGKPRNDEARLARDHLSDSTADSDDEASPGDTAGAPEPPPALVDAVLVRALHLHRALLALRRI
jgi:hypothetical protein